MKLDHVTRLIIPLVVTAALALLPAPPGLAQHAWYFFAIFAGVIVALILEPFPGGAVGLIGVTVVAVLARHVLYSPEEVAKPGFNPANAALTWALSGFSNTTVWLIFCAFIFALGYEKTGLGNRIALLLVKWMGRRTLSLGYAITVIDAILAPFTPSNTARSAGTIYPIIRQLPALYESHPNDPSARRMGSYIMWVAIAATSITSSMFLTAMAPNLLATEITKKIAHVEIGWMQWFIAFAPAGIVLLILTPLLVYWLYPPEVKQSEKVSDWAASQLIALGKLTRHEMTLGILVALALSLWIFGSDWINSTTVAMAVVALMIVTKVLSWEDITKHAAAWNTLTWFATLVALADGLNRVGFVKWLAEAIGHQLGGLSPNAAMLLLVAIFFLLHYLFASVTAHVTAVLPVMLATGATIPGMPMPQYAMLLCLTFGIMGIISPYATGPSPVYYGSGFLPSSDYWRLGAIFGLIFLVALLAIGTPWLFALR